MQSRKLFARHGWFTLALPLFCGLLLWLGSGTAYAADFTVTTTADTFDGTCDADCSLRDAVAATNLAGGADTITLAAGTYTLSIAGTNEDGGATGDLDITDDLTINGAGEATTILDGGAIDRVLHVLSGAVVINGVTIQNGNAFDVGGGIRNAGNLTINSSTITDNTAMGGGGIYNTNYDYTLTTTGQPGGPTYNFIDISGTGTAPGIFADTGSKQSIGFDFTFYGESYDTVYISRHGYLTFIDQATNDGNRRRLPQNDQMPVSAIFAFWEYLDQGGGDIYVAMQGSAPNRQFIVQYHNVSVGGSPIRFQIILNETSNTILLQYDDVATNATTQGGNATVGILDKEERTSGIGYSYRQAVLTNGLAIQFMPLPADGNLLLDDVTLSFNSADGGSMSDSNARGIEGGGLFNNGTATVRNGSLITENFTQVNAQGNGAGLANRNGTLTVQSSTIYSNTDASRGNGAGISNFYGTTTIENSTIEANFAPAKDGSGVGLANAFGTMIVTSSVITGNASLDTHNTSGAGIHNLFGKLVLSDTVVANNTLLEGNSGAGIQSIHGIVEISNSTISGNSVGDSSSGAGIDAIKSRVIIDGSTIADNLNQSTFDDNINSDGGGIRINQGELTITNSTISGNQTGSGDGGGIAHISGGERPIAYTMFDNRFYADGPSYDFVDIAGSGTALTLGNDDASLQSLGFDFTFYDMVVNQVYVSSNGYLTFENVNTTSTVTRCDEDGVKSSIYGFWADLDPSAGGQIYVETQGSAPNRHFLVQYNNVPFNGNATTVTFQIVLVEGTNAILFHYQDVASVGRLMDTLNIVIGLDSPLRGTYDESQAMRHHTTCADESILPEDGLAIAFEPAGGLTIANSTISGNSAGGTGGGIYYDGVITGGAASLVNTTIAFNNAPTGAGINDVSGSLTLTNTIVTSNTTGGDCAGGVTSGGNNLDSDGSCNLIATGDIPAGNAALGPLADNGGDTLTHLLLAGSAAIHTANSTVCQAWPVNGQDQRGVARLVSLLCDIGAVEVDAPEINVQGNGNSIADGDASPDSADHTAFGNVTVGDSLQRTFTIQNSGNADLTDVLVTVDGSACAAGANTCAIPAGDFTLVSAPDTTIAAGDSSSFTIEFAPSAAGLVESVVSIASNDSNENPYTFAVNGNGVVLTQITIVLDAVPNLPTNLGFQGSFGPFILDDPALDDSDAYTNTKSFTVAPGSYTVRRNNPAGWFTTAIACSPDGKAVTNVAQRSAAITVAEGDNVTCTFTVERAAVINARAFNDLVRRTTNLGKRNAGDPWLNSQPMTLTTSPTQTLGSGVTAPVGTFSQYSFINLRAGAYTVCTAFPVGWTLTTPTAVDPAYGQPCKTVTLAAGQIATVLFGAYEATVVASEAFTPEDELITDEDSILDRPYDPAEDETATEEDGAPRLFLPLVVR